MSAESDVERETNEFPTAVAASLTSGIVLCEFSKIHEAAEFVLGHPVWTHHFASRELWQAMKAAVDAQIPGMPTKDDMAGVTKENWREHAKRMEEKFGPTVRLRRGDGHTAMHPLDGIPGGKPVIVVKT